MHKSYWRNCSIQEILFRLSLSLDRNYDVGTKNNT